ncbi:unnamed protein product [Litomosoides sigmodontis]|uniref:Uncharacterized protein n=1 Tax=Litomosoides sigmodontis TaxID=42156 RepID=A0A3P6U7J7_LITSI|nr:unnamed protein product [Litomosoides sigmodontis]
MLEAGQPVQPIAFGFAGRLVLALPEIGSHCIHVGISNAALPACARWISGSIYWHNRFFRQASAGHCRKLSGPILHFVEAIDVHE